MAQTIAQQVRWPHLVSRMTSATPEAFGDGGAPLNLIGGEWTLPGTPRPVTSPVDGSVLGALPFIGAADATRAVQLAAAEGPAWATTDLDERRACVSVALEALRAHRDLIARILIWEIGKPLAQAEVDVDRCISGVEWYVDGMEEMMRGRQPLGLVSNIASWNYPFSVLMHAVLVQALTGNAVIAKTPTDGGLFSLTLGFALARRAGLPVSLVSGSGGELSEALVRSPEVDCLAFVGGRSSGRQVAAAVVDQRRRHMLEMEGVNAYGVWEFSDWASLADQIRKGFDYGKQRCTAYARFVVQRRLLPQFLEAYLPVVRGLRVGNPTLTDGPGDQLPKLDFGPLINAAQVQALREQAQRAMDAGAMPIYTGELDRARFLDGQDDSAYLAPMALLAPPRSSDIYYKEPFGPLDTIVVVDRPDELIAEMNVSNGALVGSLACDDPAVGNDLLAQVRAFKTGLNKVRSRGDREEVFGGTGESWKGAFVGGAYLVQGVTRGPEGERLFGNFPDYTLQPAAR
ncbi:MAG TPA: aldehyde dehydrogenase family protein [Longimicrobiaceae bacterium]|jgi:acyl-CoA reductase-like NAD-dependent aldehyde dehydrogenase|nr:aldehyde dehydrogenase family protein [Longimicrobiaceae bacterium]